MLFSLKKVGSYQQAVCSKNQKLKAFICQLIFSDYSCLVDAPVEAEEETGPVWVSKVDNRATRFDGLGAG